eukprot:UN07472
MLILGAAVFSLVCWGITAVRLKSGCFMIIYLLLMLCLGVAQTALVITLFVNEDALMDDINSQKARDFIENHFDFIRYILIGLYR